MAIVVLREKQRFFAAFPKVLQYEMHDIRIRESEDGRTATANFATNWIMAGVDQIAGATRQRITFQRINGMWKIQSEEQL